MKHFFLSLLHLVSCVLKVFCLLSVLGAKMIWSPMRFHMQPSAWRTAVRRDFIKWQQYVTGSGGHFCLLYPLSTCLSLSCQHGQNSIMQHSSCISCQTLFWQADVSEMGRGTTSKLMPKPKPPIKHSQPSGEQHLPAPEEETHTDEKHSAWSLPDLQAMSTSFSKSVWGHKTRTLKETFFLETIFLDQ